MAFESKSVPSKYLTFAEERGLTILSQPGSYLLFQLLRNQTPPSAMTDTQAFLPFDVLDTHQGEILVLFQKILQVVCILRFTQKLNSVIQLLRR